MGDAAKQGHPIWMLVMIQDGDDPILEPVSDFLMARAGAILQNLPRLIPMLRDPGPDGRKSARFV